MSVVLLKSGKVVKREVFFYTGASFIGDPTAYFVGDAGLVWVKPGESVDWMEA